MAILRSGSSLLRVGGGGGMLRVADLADLYQWYPSLDLSQVPFHVGAGAWGPQESIETPAAPVTTRQVSVDTIAELETEAQTPGTEITVTASLGDVALTAADVTDIDLIVNPGVRIDSIIYGHAFTPATVTRFRIRGTTVGSYSGGVVVGLRGLNTQQDVILDGFGISGGGTSDAALYPAGGTMRMAIVNCRLHTNHLATFFQDVSHLVIAGNSIASGGAIDPGGSVGRWGLRHDGQGPVLVYANDIRDLSDPGENSYHRMRSSPRIGGSQKYVWVDTNRFVDLVEGKAVWAARVDGNGGTDKITGYWANNNECYLESAIPGDGYYLQAVDAYARATGCAFYGDFAEAHALNNEANTEASDADFTTGNSYNPTQAPPAWGSGGKGSGDPTGLPLS